MIYELPPLILHPFGGPAASAELLASSRESLRAGLLDGAARVPGELERLLIVHHLHEMRMLFYLGKDVARWIEQCGEWLAHVQALRNSGIGERSFAHLLTRNPPPAVAQKLEAWGVASPQSIFARALGLHALLREPPDSTHLTDEFIRHYHVYADQLFESYQARQPFAVIGPDRFSFELYASGEYSRMLEEQWKNV